MNEGKTSLNQFRLRIYKLYVNTWIYLSILDKYLVSVQESINFSLSIYSDLICQKQTECTKSRQYHIFYYQSNHDQSIIDSILKLSTSTHQPFMFRRSIPSQRVRGTKPCNRGPDCHFLKQGQCWFYHPPEHTNKNTYARKNTLTSIFQGFAGFRQQQTFQSFLFKMLRQRKQQQQKAEIQKQRILRIRQRQRQRERQRERLRQIRANQDRLIAERRIRLQQMLALRSKPSQPGADFEWYFNNNKSFKALETPEEKLKELDQCIICFSSFWDHQKHCHEEGESKPNPIPEEFLQKELTELYCKHTFHKQCIKKWLLKNPNCPVCRKNFREHAQCKKFEEQKKAEKQPVKIMPQRSLSLLSLSSDYNNFHQDSDYEESDIEDQWSF